jgi:hypothetical protein
MPLYTANAARLRSVFPCQLCVGVHAITLIQHITEQEMSLFKQFEQHWVDRAKATSLLLAHEENAEWVEDTMQTFAAELEDGLRIVFPSYSQEERHQLIRNPIAYIWNRKLAIASEPVCLASAFLRHAAAS